jgi:xanthine dehydrogenase accessory factor
LLGAEGLDWREAGLEDDVRPRMFAQSQSGQPFALATIISADGGPRPIGAQMVIVGDASWGFLSGGCIEDDVARNARSVLADGEPRQLVYGWSSPFVDIRLPCGGRLEVLVERVPADDAAVEALENFARERQPATWSSNGRERTCGPADQVGAVAGEIVRKDYAPAQRLLVVGTDPIALALAAMGTAMGWDTTLIAPFGPSAAAPFGVHCDRRPLDQAMSPERLDHWTAVAVAAHDMDLDEAALALALPSRAGYVGVLGSRRKLDERKQRLWAKGLKVADTDRLHAPIGLDIGAQSPWEVAVAIVGEIIAQRARETASRAVTADKGTRVPA